MHPPARILIACDKFKGSLDAPAVCSAIACGLASRFPQAFIELFPIADGGEGFAASLQNPLGGRWVETSAHDALGRPITARYLLSDTSDGPLAVIEMAEASGMWRIRAEERDISASLHLRHRGNDAPCHRKEQGHALGDRPRRQRHQRRRRGHGRRARRALSR
jgi:hypothetical protein